MARVIGRNNEIVQKKEKGVKTPKIKKQKKMNKKLAVILGVASFLILSAILAIIIVVVLDKDSKETKAEDNAIVKLVDSYYDDDYKTTNAADRPAFGPRVAIKTTDQILQIKNGTKNMPDNYYIYVYNSLYGDVEDEDNDNVCLAIEKNADGILKLMKTVIESEEWYLYIIDLADESNSTTVVEELTGDGTSVTLAAPQLIRVEGTEITTKASSELSANGFVSKIKTEIAYIKTQENDLV